MGQRKKSLFLMGALWASLGGVLVFYLLPFLASTVYAFTNNPIQKQFVGWKNFQALFHNSFFLLGLKNTLLFMALAIPSGMTVSLLLALWIKNQRRGVGILTLCFLLPLVLPSATIARTFLYFYTELLNFFRIMAGLAPLQKMSAWESRFLMVLIYLWKYSGYHMVLFQTGLYAIPEEYYQCAALFGAGKWQRFRMVTLVYLTPCFSLVFLMSFVNAFKIFREIYFLYGDYPGEGAYLLQHFMNSTLLSLNYQKLVSAVYVLTLLVTAVVLFVFQGEKRISRELTD